MGLRITRCEIRGVSMAVVAFSVAACSGGGTVPQGTTTGTSISPSLSAAHPPKYRLVILGDELFPEKINDNGFIVGSDAHSTSTTVAFEYKNGEVTDLPQLSGDTNSEANDVNNDDQTVGQSSPAGGALPMHAVLWQHGNVTDLGAVPQAPGSPPNDFNAALAINDGGEIVGYSGTPSVSYITIFSPGSPHGIAFGGGVFQGAATGINDEGEIVGVAVSSNAFVPFAYPNPVTCSPPPTISGGFDRINNRGDTLWINETQFPLASVFCGHGISQRLHMFENGMNDRGDVVGQNTEPPPPQNYDGVLYSNGSYFVLNNLVDNAENIDFLPTSVNNGGEITGFAFSLSNIAPADVEHVKEWYRSARANPHHSPTPPIPNNSEFGFLLVPE